ncbi:MAG: TolC family protein [Spirochaetaceae bacterium]|jgi:outer membrane protein TolC|nr:TolC family protein [Spirochaetaceae bacterium]
MKPGILLCLPLFFNVPLLRADPEPVRVITLESVRTLALENSFSLKKEALNLELSRIQAKNLWAQVLPSLSASGAIGHDFPLNDAAPSAEPSISASLRLSLGLSAAIPYTMKRISLSYQKSLVDYNRSRQQLLLESSKAFYSLLTQKNYLTVLEGAMNLAAEQLERNRVARQNGYIGELDFLSSGLSAERARLVYNKALSEYRLELKDFLATLGIEGGDEVTLEGNVEITKIAPDPEELIALYLPRHLELQSLRNEVERLRAARGETALSTRGPSVNLSTSWGVSRAGGFNDSISGDLSVSIPLDPWIPRSRQDQVFTQARVEHEKALMDLQDAENSVRREIRGHVERIKTTWTEVEIARLNSGYAQRAYDLAAQAYRMGTMNFLDFETLRNRLTEARQQQFESELAYQILILDLASVLNVEEETLLRFRTGSGE